jgi:hypothetical protein
VSGRAQATAITRQPDVNLAKNIVSPLNRTWAIVPYASTRS